MNTCSLHLNESAALLLRELNKLGVANQKWLKNRVDKQFWGKR